MSSTYLSTNPFSHVAIIGHAPERGPEKLGMHVKELSEGDRHRLLMHFLALDASARLLRFGMIFPDELMTTYVQQMNFARDTLFGVYDSALMLIGVGHLAFTPREALPVVARAPAKSASGSLVYRYPHRRAAWASAPGFSNVRLYTAVTPMWTP